MLSVSGLQSKLATITKQDGSPYVINGDPADGVSRTILAPYRGSQLTPQQVAFNRAMSHMTVLVEWTLGKIVANFSYLDFKKSNKVLLQPIGKYYLVAALLTNCHTCLYGSQTSICLVWIHHHWRHIYPMCDMFGFANEHCKKVYATCMYESASFNYCSSNCSC